MSVPKNQAAWLIKAGATLEIGDAPLPTAGPGEIVVRNAAVAINPLDWHMLDSGIFLQEWPAVFGCDAAGVVHEVGSGVSGFQKGDRVIGRTATFVTGRSRDGAFALYTVVLEDKAAILPDNIAFTDGAVIPLALESAVCALFVKNEGEALPGVATPALGLRYPSLKPAPASEQTKTLVIYGGSSSVGSMTTQLASAAGINVLAVAGAHNADLCKRSGAAEVFDRNGTDLVEKIAAAVKELGEDRFVGVFDAISVPETYSNSLAILEKLGGGHLACVHPPPADVPANVKAGMIFAFNDAATPIWRDYATPALESGKLLCLPPAKVVGKGLENIQEALAMSKAGVSAQKLVVEL